jgi:hypothetical protein
VAFSGDGARIFGRDRKGKVLAWDTATGCPLPDAPAGIPAGRSAATHGNLRARADGPLVRVERLLTPEDVKRLGRQEERIQRLQANRASRDFHAAEAESAEVRKQPFAAVFHLDRLLPLLPGERPRLLGRRLAVLAAALKKAPGDAWAVRALARQAVADPGSVPNCKELLPQLAALAKQGDAASNRLYGAVLLRSGSPREAVPALQTALARRDPGAAPVEELLLALAHSRVGQLTEARKHHQAAVAWMQPGSEPVRAAALAGLAARGPLFALGSLPVTPPDPRLLAMDQPTAHELFALRGEVERCLGGQ